MIVEKISIIAASFFLLLVAWEDFRRFKVRNKSVLYLLGLYLIYAIARGDFEAALLDLGAGLLLFFIGFVFWLLGLMGAGDVKLYFAVGCWVGLLGISSWAIMLLVCSILMLILVRVQMPLSIRHYMIIDRFEELRNGKKVPYAVPISLATIISLVPNAFS